MEVWKIKYSEKYLCLIVDLKDIFRENVRNLFEVYETRRERLKT